MGKTQAIGIITVMASYASLSKPQQAHADGPFSFSPFGGSSPSPSPNVHPPAQASSSAASPPGNAEAPPPPPKVRNDHPRTTSAGFDPEALERGAEALKKITKSSEAKKVCLWGFLVGLN